MKGQSKMLVNSNNEPKPLSTVPTEAPTKAAGEDEWPGIDSRYRLIVVAALRSQQLLHGSSPRVDADPRRRRSTSIALEEVKRGLIHFTITTETQ